MTSKYGIEIYPINSEGDLKRKVFVMLCPSEKEREKWLSSFENAFSELRESEGREGREKRREEEAGVFSISGNSEMALQQVRLLSVKHRIEGFNKNFGSNFHENCLEEGTPYVSLSALLFFYFMNFSTFTYF